MTLRSPAASDDRPPVERRRGLPRWVKPLFGVAFLALVAWLVADHARHIDWAGVGEAIAAYPATTLAAAAAVAVASHLTYASYDLLGRRYVNHRLATRAVLGTAFVSYAFNLNLGSLVGGVGLRFRLYGRLGLTMTQIGRVIALSLATNWSGWALLAGTTFALGAVQPPASLPLDDEALRLIGLALVGVPLGYVLACFTSRRREWRWRTHTFVLPSGRMALAQLALSSLNWALIAVILSLLLPKELSYGSVLATLLSAAIVGAAVHVPGGLGVIEAVFIAAVGDRVPAADLVAGLLAYRALYYLAPLALAAALHFGVEALARRQ